jgi:hypothetical protein
MFAKCSNPNCTATFDYREGRLIRFSKPPLDGSGPADDHSVEHFWLCGSCSKFYGFEYERGAGMNVKLRWSEMGEGMTPSFVGGRERARPVRGARRATAVAS